MMEMILTKRNIEQTVSFAADELRRYLQRMLGDEEGVFSVSLGVESNGDSMDEFSVDMELSGGSIVGSNPRSVLLGVYDYLHHLGCRFLTPVKETEIVPRICREQLPAKYTKRASFKHRGVCIEGANTVENVLDFIDWLPKVGYNSFFLQFQVPYIFLSRWYHHDMNPFAEAEDYTMDDAQAAMKRFEEAMTLRSLLLHKVGHGWTGEVLGSDTVGSWNAAERAVAPEKLDMAAQVDGKRGFYMGIPANTNLCFSNSQTAETFTELVVQYARKNSSVDYLHVWLADEYNNVCECEECRKTTVSDQYVELLNEIDRRLTEEGLSTKLVFLLYQELLWPAVKARLRNPDRFLLMFAPISRTFEQSYDLSKRIDTIPEYRRNSIVLPTSLGENLAFLKGWQEQFSGEGFVYDYPLGRAHYGDFGYLHISRIISQDIKKLRQMGLDGYISCQELRACSPNMLPNYVMGYTLFHEEADVEELIREYFEAAYPGESQLAQEYLEELSCLSSCDYLNGKGPRENPDIAWRMGEIMNLCCQMELVLTAVPEGAHWKALRRHNGYILRLAGAMEALASGKSEAAMERYLQMRRFICSTEPEFQPWLDVYRILEVTQKYTGFYIKGETQTNSGFHSKEVKQKYTDSHIN